MLPPGESGFRCVLRFYEKNAMKKGLEFTLEME